MKPLALSDRQLTTVLTGAEKLKPHLRHLFLRFVANELADEHPTTDAAFPNAVDLILEDPNK
jgi:hypothetical protein